MSDPNLLDDVRNALTEAYGQTMDMEGPNFTIMAEAAIDAVLTPEVVGALALGAALSDGGCSVCVEYQTVVLARAFPGYDWPQLVFDADEFQRATLEDLQKACKP